MTNGNRATCRRRLVVAAAALALPLLATACRASGPAIEITDVPPGAAGGPERMVEIAGRAQGAQAGDSVVIFARSGLWYVQPFVVNPHTTIRSDGSWSTSTHLGAEYAALLVRAGYRPPPTVDALPEVGGAVLAVVRVTGVAGLVGPVPRSVDFSGYRWTIRQNPSDRGGQNQYDPENVRVADDGALHLSVTRRQGAWASAEVSLSRTLGYGTYAFSVRDTSTLDPAVVLSLYTYDTEAPLEHFREMAISVQRPDSRARANGQYVLQPNDIAANVSRFAVPVGTVTHLLRWEPGRVVFTTSPGARAHLTRTGGTEREFSVGVPPTGKEQIRMALSYFRNSPRPPQRDAEVVIERFQHFP